MKKNYLIKHVLGTLIFFSVIFISAGRINYWQGLLYVAVGMVMVVLNYTILRPDAKLLEERSSPGEDSKKWDKNILLLSFVITIAMYITAGLDSGRYNWSPEFPWIYYLLGIILTATGQLLFLIAQKQNKFFSSVVRIQKDRGHEVYKSGLYKIVRHPAYLGSFIQSLGFPLIFGSLWSAIPVFISVVILLIRTKLEDETLMKELNGYVEYSQKTRYKIIPFIW